MIAVKGMDRGKRIPAEVQNNRVRAQNSSRTQIERGQLLRQPLCLLILASIGFLSHLENHLFLRRFKNSVLINTRQWMKIGHLEVTPSLAALPKLPLETVWYETSSKQDEYGSPMLYITWSTQIESKTAHRDCISTLNPCLLCGDQCLQETVLYCALLCLVT